MTTAERIKRHFNRGCTQYGLLEDGDRILVALSGGKDSLMLCRLLAQRSRIYRPHITVEAAYVAMDNIPYASDTEYLESYCTELGIKLHVLHSQFDQSTDPRKTACFLCAWNRRKTLFQFATDNGFNKVALGHHMDDILVTWLMNIIHEGNAGTMRPMLKMEHYPICIIRPLCLVHEEWIREEAQTLGFVGQKKRCPHEQVTRRAEVEALFHQIETMNPEARYSMWQALEKLEKENNN